MTKKSTSKAVARTASRKLSPKQLRFVDEFLVDCNATQAAIRAGYGARNADKVGARLVGKSGVAAAIAARQQERSERVQLKADDVLSELRTIVRSNVQHFSITMDGGVELARDAPADAWSAVASVKQKTRHIPQEDGETIVEHQVELRLWDKPRALDLAMRHLGIEGFKDTERPSVNVTFNVVQEGRRFGDVAQEIEGDGK